MLAGPSCYIQLYFLSTLIGEGFGLAQGVRASLAKVQSRKGTERGPVQGEQKAPFEVAPQNVYKNLKPGIFKAFMSVEH